KDDAVEILKSLSGKRHVVYTGFTVIKDDFLYSDFESTNVYFRSLTQAEIIAYVNSGEPMDKAGAYGIQQLGALLVNKIHGDYFNVMGLPINRIAVTFNEKLGINILCKNN
ncbi:MAG: Maf family protein, partial [Clostridia bacterium]|nr:Maf family protein [Clostridia bacterium]